MSLVLAIFFENESTRHDASCFFCIKGYDFSLAVYLVKKGKVNHFGIYRLGASTILEVNDAQQRYDLSVNRFVNARYAVIFAALEIQRIER
jgi:hypothetical protein